MKYINTFRSVIDGVPSRLALLEGDNIPLDEEKAKRMFIESVKSDNAILLEDGIAGVYDSDNKLTKLLTCFPFTYDENNDVYHYRGYAVTTEKDGTFSKAYIVDEKTNKVVFTEKDFKLLYDFAVCTFVDKMLADKNIYKYLNYYNN